jgi:hypothetical protein
MAEVQWYYARNDQQYGPVSATELRQLADAGQLTPDDLLWREGMDAWTTAINLRGLFDPPASAAAAAGSPRLASPGAPARPLTVRGNTPPSAPASLRSLLRVTQTMLWCLCVLVVLVGLVLFTRAFLAAHQPAELAEAGAVSCTFFVAAYVLARAGEKLSRLLLNLSRRRGR